MIARAALLGAALVCAARAAAAQLESRVQVGARFDLLASHTTAVQAGLEASVQAGRTVRIALVTAVGESWRSGNSGLSARADIVGRFLLDPDRRSRWAPYFGGGLGLRYDDLADWRGTLIALLGVEGPNWSGVVPFVEAGVGGGVRLGFGVRRARRAGR